MSSIITYHKNKSPADNRRDEDELGTGFAHVFDQFVDQFGGGATGRRRAAGADRGRAGVCRGAAFVGPTRRRREVAVAEAGRTTVAEDGRVAEEEDGRGRKAPAEAGRVPNRDRFFCEVAAAAARARLMLRLSGRGGRPALKANL